MKSESQNIAYVTWVMYITYFLLTIGYKVHLFIGSNILSHAEGAERDNVQWRIEEIGTNIACLLNTHLFKGETTQQSWKKLVQIFRLIENQINI